MTQSFLRYKPQDGYIHNWLVAGPQIIPIDTVNLDSKLNRQQIASHFWQADAGIEDSPCEQAKFAPSGMAAGDGQLTWRYLRCEHDHLVDLADTYPEAHYLRAWAYAELISPVAQRIHLRLDAFGPAQIWLNGEVIARQVDFAEHLPHGVSTEANLMHGANSILVRLEQLCKGPTPFAIALKVSGADPKRLQLRLPTLNPNVKKHLEVERLAQRAYIERDLYAGKEAIFVKWPTTLSIKRPLMLRVQKPSGHVVGEAQPVVSAGFSQHLLEASWAKDGRYQVKIMPELDDHVRGLRVGQDLDVNILHSSYVDEPQGDQVTRAIEFLRHAAWWTEGIFADLATMALGLWKQVNEKALLRTIEHFQRRDFQTRGEGKNETLIGLLLMAYRFADNASMPPMIARRLKECILAFDYAAGNLDNINIQGLDDDVAIMRHACSVLAGQLYRAQPFASNGELGRWHQERGEQGALAWLTRRLHGGFAAWDSGEGFTAIILSLVVLADHAESDALADLSAATLDKLLFSLALNSFQGIFGSTHGATSATSITDARMEPTSPISRILWGVGCWNQHNAAAFALATSETYGCPPLHQMIALDRSAAISSREHHVTAWQNAEDGPVPSHEVNKVTYRTPDFMLSSAQDYRPGMVGGGEHIWQATLSPSAVVFVNHPQCLNQKDAYHANFWRGNALLPRVAQRRDLLIAIHKLPADDWLGYTHAHFPIAAFDEYTLKRGWAFARKGDGYLALTASAGLKLIKSGPGAYRELLSTGHHNIWLCQMGRAALDGSFAEFQRAILSRPVSFADLNVSLTSLRDEAIAFSWTDSLVAQGSAQPLNNFPHYESPYCTCALGATEMEIHIADATLKLNLDMSPDLLPETLLNSTEA